jgi:hypothetical protein
MALVNPRRFQTPASQPIGLGPMGQPAGGISTVSTLADPVMPPPVPVVSPNELEMKREMAAQLMKSSQQPVTDVFGGVANIADALVGGLTARKAGEKETAALEGEKASQAASRSRFGQIMANQLGITDPNVVAALGDPNIDASSLISALTGTKPEYGFENVDGTLLRTDKRGGTASPIYTAPDKGDPDIAEFNQAKKEGLIPPEVTLKEYKEYGKTSVSATATVDTAENAFAKQVGELAAKDIFERRTGAQQAAQSLQSSNDARSLLDSGVIAGFGADYILGVGKALQQAGFNVDPDPIANTEAFVATRAQEVGRIIQLFGAGTGLSDADRDFAQKAAAGQISMNEASIRKILDINDRAARNVITLYNKDAAQVPKEQVPYSMIVEMPPVAMPQTNPAPSATPSPTGGGLPALPDPSTLKEGQRAVDDDTNQHWIIRQGQWVKEPVTGGGF